MIFALNAYSINIGFNQAWFNNDYSTQYLNSKFDINEVDRIFKLTKDAGSKTLRLWFFESLSLKMIEFDKFKPVHLKQEYIENVIRMLRVAEKYNVKVYMTLFDAHVYKLILKSGNKARFRSLLHPKNGRYFLKNILKPLLRSIYNSDLSHTIGKIDLVNEGDTLVNRGAFDHNWMGVKQMICEWRDSIHVIKGFNHTPVTFSIRLHPQLHLPFNLLAKKGPMECADVIDFHSYSDKGKIYRCNWIKRKIKSLKKKFILGEFGQGFFNHRYSDDLQVENIKKYIASARKCGFSEMLAWRLSDVRDGDNKEARYSFESFGATRPAYKIIQDSNFRN